MTIRLPLTLRTREADVGSPKHVGSPTSDCSPSAARVRGGLAALAVFATLALYGWLLAPQLGKPFVYDDVNFALGAQAVARTGLPYGNQGYLLHLYEQREQWALWHPPLYMYALGLTIRLFGESEAAARGLGVLCQLVAAGVSFDLARRLTGTRSATDTAGLVAGVLAVALFLLGPLTIQVANILDIDNTVLMLLITLFVWVVIRLPGRWQPSTVVGLAVFFALTLWAKLTTPLLLLAAIVFTRGFGPIGWRGAREALAVGVLGWALFLATWLAVTSLTGMPSDYTFIVVSREALESGTSTRDRFVSWAAFAAGAAPALLWLGPFLCLLFVQAGLPRLWRLLRGHGLEPGDVVIVLGAAIYLVYIMKLAGSFPKYHAAMLPLWAAACGAAVVRAAGRPSWGQLAVILVGSAAVFGWLQAHADLWAIEWDPALIRLLILVPLLVGLGMAGLWAQLGRVSPLRAAPVSMAALALAWSLALDQHQRGLAGSTTYYYGRYGQVEAARALAERLRPDELYIASKEVAWYSRDQRYVDQESWQHVVWDLGQGFDGTWLGQPVRLLALELGERSVRGTYERALVPRYRVVGEFGNFVIFERAS